MREMSELEQKVAHVRGYARALASAMWLMDERRYLLQPLFSDDEVRKEFGKKLDGTMGARAYHQLIPLLAGDLLRDLVRLLLDDDKRSGSFPNVFRKASEPTILAALREYHRTIPDRWDREDFTAQGFTKEEAESLHEEFLRREREDYGKAFDSGVATVERAIRDLELNPVAAKMKTFRDKNHAHLEMRPFGQDPVPFPVKDLGLTFNDIFDFADRYKPAILELVRLVTAKSFAMKSFTDAHQKYGSDFWRTLAGLPVLKK